MDNEPKDDSVNKLAWSVLIVGGIAIVSVLAWKWYSHTAETPAPEVAQVATAPVAPVAATETAPSFSSTPPPATTTTPPSERKSCDILVHDPGAIARQSDQLRKQAASKSEIALPEERIKALEQKKLLLQ